MKISLLKPDLPTKLLESEVIPLDKVVDKEGPDILLPEFLNPQRYIDSLSVLPLSSNHPKGVVEVENKHGGLELSSAVTNSHPQKYSDSSFVLLLSGNDPKEAVEVENKHAGLELFSARSDDSAKLLTPSSNVSNLEHQNKLGSNLINNGACKGETSGWKNSSLEPGNVYVNNPVVGNINLFNVALQAEQYGVGHAYYSNFLHSALSDAVKSGNLCSYHDAL